MEALQAEPAAHEGLTDEASFRYEGWTIVAVCFLVATFTWAFGFYGQGVYLAEMQRIHGWPASLISTATTCYFLFSSVLVVFVSEGIRRLGPRMFLVGGACSMAAAVALMGQVESLWQLYAVYALMSVGWAGTSIAAINNTLGLWFDTKRGMAISYALNGASIGGVFGVPLLVAAIGKFGFATTQVMAAVVMLAVAVPVILFWVGPPPRAAMPGSEANCPGQSAGPKAASIRAEAFRTLSFWTIVIPFSLVLLAQAAFLVHAISFLDPIIGRDKASIAVALMTAFAVIGRLIVGVVIDRFDQRIASSVLFVSQTIALLVAINTRDDILLFAASALFGFTLGNAITLPSLIVQREFPAASFGVLVSLVTAICQFTYAFGPGMAGLLRDLSGGYAAPFYACVGLQLVAAVIVLFGRKPKIRSDRSNSLTLA